MQLIDVLPYVRQHGVDYRRIKALPRLACCWLRQAACAARGHDFSLRRERERLSLRCTRCDYQTPGWAIGRGRRP